MPLMLAKELLALKKGVVMISEKILEFAKKGRARVAIGLVKTNSEIVASLHRAVECADIIVVGEEIRNISNVIISNNSPHREQLIAEKLVDMLVNKDIDAVIRGNIVASKILPLLAKRFGYDKVLRSAILKDVKGREFFLTPAAVTEGNFVKERLCMAVKTAKFAQGMGIVPKIAVLQTGDTHGLSEYVEQSIDEADYIAGELSKLGYQVCFKGYAIEKAVEACNLIISRNGIVGNAIWRSIIGLGGVQEIGDFCLIPEIFIDGSKYWDDYYQTILFAVALVNMRKEGHVQ